MLIKQYMLEYAELKLDMAMAINQLEQELADNVWLSVASTPELVLDTPFDQRWHAAAARLGVDMSLIATQVGHG